MTPVQLRRSDEGEVPEVADNQGALPEAIMVWSFLWRFVAYSLVIAWVVAQATRFAVVFGPSWLPERTVFGVLLFFGLVLCGVDAYLTAKAKHRQSAQPELLQAEMKRLT